MKPKPKSSESGSINLNWFVPAIMPELGQQSFWLNLGMIGFVLVAGVGLAFISVYLDFRLALLAILLLVVGWLTIRQPEIGLLLVVFIIPFEDFNTPAELGPLSVAKLLGLWALVAYAIHYFVVSQDRKLVFVPQNIFIFLFLLAVVVSDLVAVDPAYAVDKTFKLVRVLGFYLLVINIVRTRASLHHLLWVMVIAGTISAVYGLYEYYFTPEILDEMRVTGTYTDSLGFAYATVILLPVIWYLFKHDSRTVVRIFLAFVGAIFLYGIILSGARSGIGIAAVVLVWLALREKRALLSLTVVATLLVAAYLLLPVSVQTRLGLTPDTDKAAQASTERRETYNDYAVQLFLQEPFIGSGLGGFAQQYSQSEYRFLQGQEDVRRVAHNMYLEFAVGTGLLGLIPFFLILASAWIGLQRVIMKAPSEAMRDMAKMVQISLTAFLLVGLFSSSQYDKPLWLLIGLAAITPLLVAQEAVADRLR